MATPPDASVSKDGERRRAGDRATDPAPLGYPLVERRRGDGAGGGWDGVERRQDPSVSRTTVSATPPIAPFRWAALGLGFVLGIDELANGDWWVIVAGLALVAVTVWRTLQPVPVDGRPALGWVALDAAIATAIVLTSGAWGSPWVLALVAPTLAAGFSRVSAYAAEQTGAAAVIVTGVWLIGADQPVDRLETSVLWVSAFLVIALVSGFVRKVSFESARQQSIALSQVGRLTEANSLLVSLHRVAQTLPASLDLDDVLDSTIGRLRELMVFDAVTIFLHEEDEDTWVPARRSGNREQAALSRDRVPAAARARHRRARRGHGGQPRCHRRSGRRATTQPAASTQRCGHAARSSA